MEGLVRYRAALVNGSASTTQRPLPSDKDHRFAGRTGFWGEEKGLYRQRSVLMSGHASHAGLVSESRNYRRQ